MENLELADKKLLIIVPAYNEEKNIAQFLDSLETSEITAVADVLIIDDGSRDNTCRILKARNHVPVITHTYNLGYGSALQTGFKYAVRRGYPYVLQMDADGQHDPQNVLKLYQVLTTADADGKLPDIVLGSRFMEGSAPYRAGVCKRCAIGLFRGLIRLATGQRIADPTTGLQALSRRVVIFYSKYNHFDNKYPDANMLMQMLLLGYRVKEVPAIMRERTEGVSMHSGLKPVVYMFRMAFCMMAVWWRIKVLKIEKGAPDEA